MTIRLEQLVYGSFPFWDRGYDVLARSPGCRAEWVADALAACRRFGEAPAGVAAAPGLFALRLASGPWAVVGVGPRGVDDRGRPGALAFHALVIARRDYRRAGSNPFAFAGALRRDWSAGSTLGALAWPIEVGPAHPTEDLADPRARRVVEALARGRRVALEADGPIDALARSVWPALPDATRRRASLATWAFGNGNRFDLVALPRLAGVVLDRSYIDPAALDQPEPAPPPRSGWVPRPTRPALAASTLALAAIVAGGLIWRGSNHHPAAPTLADPTPARPPETPPEGEIPVGPEERARVVAGLGDLAERFEAFDVGTEADARSDPAALMARFADRLRYRGATLTPADLAGLAAEADPDRVRALAWHERIKPFTDDDGWPPDFARWPLPRQLDALARSFRVDPPARLDAIPEALAEALSRDGPIRPTPLAAKYPALSDYARFLGRLPRKKAPAAGTP